MIHNSFVIHEFADLESTNKTAFELAGLNKISNREIILSKKQTAGKGRKNRSWSSPVGNLYFSILLKPQIDLQKIPQISFVAAAALKLAISKLSSSLNIQLKWPNDLLLEEKKAAGILLESKLNGKNCEFVIMGIGVNIESNPEQTIFPATNLKEQNIEISPTELLKKFLDEFENLYQSFLIYGFAGVRQIWLKNAYKFKQEIKIKIDEKEIFGIFENLDDEGNLLLSQNGQIFKITTADVS